MQIFLHIITKVHNIQKYDYLSALESDQKQAENRNIYPWIVTTKVKSYEFFACGHAPNVAAPAAENSTLTGFR